jgi:nucleotide-binding universal stress UspA family protein
MVALCTHGRSDIRRVMWGSIAQLVLRRVSVPVLIVRPQEPAKSWVDTILVTVDSQHRADEALDVAGQIAAGCKVPLKLISVVPTAETLTGDRLAAARLIPISTSAALDAEQQATTGYLQEKADALRAEGLQVEMAVRRGEVTPTLAEAARAAGHALIVISTHGRAGLDAFLSGSVAQRMIGLTNQPVLLVKIPEGAEAS